MGYLKETFISLNLSILKTLRRNIGMVFLRSGSTKKHEFCVLRKVGGQKTEKLKSKLNEFLPSD